MYCWYCMYCMYCVMAVLNVLYALYGLFALYVHMIWQFRKELGIIRLQVEDISKLCPGRRPLGCWLVGFSYFLFFLFFYMSLHVLTRWLLVFRSLSQNNNDFRSETIVSCVQNCDLARLVLPFWDPSRQLLELECAL